MAAILQQPRAHEGCQGQRDDARREDGDDDGDRELAEDPADQAGHEDERQEHRRQGDRHGEDREADLPRAVQGRSEDRLAVFHPADGVLKEDDGVIDQEPDRQRQSHEREVVQAVAQQLHRDEGQQQRERKGHRGDQRVRRPTQEDKDDDDDEGEGDDQGFLDVQHRADDRQGSVIDRNHPDRARKLRGDGRKDSPDAAGHFDRIGARLAEDPDDHRAVRDLVAPGPKAHGHALVLDRVDHPGYVAHVDRSSVLLGDDEICVFLGVLQLALRSQDG